MSPKHFLYFLFFVLIAQPLFAQKNSAGKSGTTEAANEDHRFNIAKVNLLSLPLKNASVQFEKVLSKGVSIGLGLRVMPLSAIPLKGLAKNYVDDNQDAQDIINKSRISNYAVTPEVRFYLGKGYGKGLYIAPYYRYVHFSTNTFIVNYTASTGVKRSVNLEGSLTANTGGLMIGAQWFAGKHFALDWWIVGAHYGSGTGDLKGRPAVPFTPFEQNEIRQNLEDIDIPLVDKTVTVTPTTVAVNVNGAFGGLRAGFCFGFRF